MFHHESEKMNENLEAPIPMLKNPPPKAQIIFTVLGPPEKTPPPEYIFLFVQVGRALSIIFFVWHQNHGISQQMLTSDNGEKQGCATRNPTTRESVNWCSLTPHLQVEQSEFHIWRRCKGVMEEPPLQKVFNGCYF